MQSKGAISLLAVLIALACLYQLSFTAVSVIQQNKAEKFAEAAVMAEQQKPSFAEVSELDKAYYLDSIRKERNRYYIDSVSAEKVYLGHTYKEVQEKEINLGLDLKGGMNVMLEVQLSDLVTTTPLPSSSRLLPWLRKERRHPAETPTSSLFSMRRGMRWLPIRDFPRYSVPSTSGTGSMPRVPTTRSSQ